MTVNVMVPQGVIGYGEVPSDCIGGDTTKNWGNAFRGMGWDPSLANSYFNGYYYDEDGYGPMDEMKPAIIIHIDYIQ
jgi:hypothetical protein